MRVPRSHGSRVYLALVLAVVVALGVVVAGHWRVGVAGIGAVFLVGAVARSVIGIDHVGMLQVRGRLFDITWMTFLGSVLLVLALTIPAQP